MNSICYRINAGIKLFWLPTKEDVFIKNGEKKIVDTISRFMVLDNKFRERVATWKVYIRERHFPEKDIEYTSAQLYI